FIFRANGVPHRGGDDKVTRSAWYSQRPSDTPLSPCHLVTLSPCHLPCPLLQRTTINVNLFITQRLRGLACCRPLALTPTRRLSCSTPTAGIPCARASAPRRRC